LVIIRIFTMATILQCPHCGHAARSTKVVPAGAKVTCPKCEKKFPYRPPGDGPVADGPKGAIEDIPLAQDISLAELLAGEERESSAGRGVGQRVTGRPPRVKPTFDDREARALPAVDDDEPRARYESVTNSKIADNPLALAARSSKERLIGGKQVRFGDTRYKVAVVLTFVIGAALYFGFWAYRGLQKDIETAGEKAREERQRLAESGGAKPKPKATGKSEAPEGPAIKGSTKGVAAAAPALVKGNAGTPVKIGDWEISVPKAELGRYEFLDPFERLIITVRVTNNAAGPRSYRYWSRPGRNTTIQNQNGAMISLIPGLAPKEEERKMKSKESYDDILVVESGAAKFELDLTLLFPDGKSGCVIHISPGFVTRTQ
jgi:hypothetical protein